MPISSLHQNILFIIFFLHWNIVLYIYIYIIFIGLYLTLEGDRAKQSEKGFPWDDGK